MAMMMADCVGFQAQIASIIELLANSAVLEICKLVDDGYAALRSQMDLEREQSEKENDDLRRRLRDMDVRVRSYERKLKRRNQREEMHNVHYRPPEVDPTIVTVEVGQTQGPLAVNDSEPEMHHMPQEEPPALPQVKQERADCDMNMKVEIGSSAPEPHQEVPCGEQLNLCEPLPPSLTDATVDLTCRPRPRGRPKSSSKPSAASSAATLKPGTPPPSESSAPPQLPPPPVVAVDDDDDDDDDEPSPERLNSLGLDLAWMQERVGHLGAAFAQASLNHADGGGGVHPSCSYPTDMEVPPAMLFPGNAHHHDMAAFASSFDLPSANPSSLARRGPYKGVGASGGAASSSSAGKEPMVCNFCGRVYPSAASLEVHQRSHTGERPYSCQHCGKGFAQPNNLRVHLLIHSSERRYHCSLCGKSFISSSHLKRHRTVHTQEKPYTCARCGQSFSQLCSVRRHRQQSQCGV